MVWFARSALSDLNSMLELKNPTKSSVWLMSPNRSDGAGVDTLAISRERIQMFGQEE